MDVLKLHGCKPMIKMLYMSVIVLVLIIMLSACGISSDPTPNITTNNSEDEGVAESIPEGETQGNGMEESPHFNRIPTSPNIETSNLKNTLLMFAIDESTSIYNGGCEQGVDRYRIPNLFLAMVSQYYSPYVTGVASMADQSPWIDVTYWPMNGDSNNSTIGPLRASELSESARVQPRGKADGAFFDDLFEYMNTLPSFPEVRKPTKRILILFTDGSFQPISSDPTEAETQARGHRNAADEVLSSDVDVHVVLLCSDQLNQIDHDWWTSREEEGKISLHDEYEGVEDLIRELWAETLHDIFPYRWNDGWQSINLITEDGYWDMASGEHKPNIFCRDPQASLRCLGITLPPMTSGFVGGIITLSGDGGKQPLPFIWSDLGDHSNPKRRSQGEQGSFYWDESVFPTQDCMRHEWVLFPVLRPGSMALFWWRTAGDVNLYLDENYTLSNTSIYIEGGEILNQVKTYTHVNIQPGGFSTISPWLACYEEILLLDQDNSENTILGRMPLQEKIGWDIRHALEQLFEARDIPLESMPPESFEKKIVVRLDYIGEDGVYSDVEDVDGYALAMNVRVRYLPGFLLDEYKHCSDENTSQNGGGWTCLDGRFTLRYVDDIYFPSEIGDAFRPELVIVNNDGEVCGGPFSIPDEGYKFRIKLVSSDADVAVYSLNLENFNCAGMTGFRVQWPGWSPQGVFSDYQYHPRAVECNLYQDQCEYISTGLGEIDE